MYVARFDACQRRMIKVEIDIGPPLDSEGRSALVSAAAEKGRNRDRKSVV